MNARAHKWKEVRGRGKLRYILLNGVVAWGLPMFVVMTFVLNEQPADSYTPGRMAVQLVVWLAGGAIFGLITWHLAEHNYMKELEREKTREATPVRQS